MKVRAPNVLEALQGSEEVCVLGQLLLCDLQLMDCLHNSQHDHDFGEAVHGANTKGLQEPRTIAIRELGKDGLRSARIPADPKTLCSAG